jgi:hypothetical protein
MVLSTTSGRGKVQETLAIPIVELELMLLIQPEESLEWQAQRNKGYTGWHVLESPEQLVGLAQSISLHNDWFSVQTKTLGEHRSGRYAQTMNPGSGYLLEVAQINCSTAHNWRIGLGAASDNDGNEPYEGVTDSQMINLAGGARVLAAWAGVRLGYGAALRVYHSD